MITSMVQARRQNSHMTFKANLDVGRHGWLRLTPAYSYKLVADAINAVEAERPLVLDPFSGSGTTGLVAAERGLDAHLVDVNPFLVWFACAKTRNYLPEQLEAAEQVALEIAAEGPSRDADNLWQPKIHNAERWWSESELAALKIVREMVVNAQVADEVRDLLLIAFCRTLIGVSNAAFNHQSMSFKEADNNVRLFDIEGAATWERWGVESATIVQSAASDIPGKVSVYLGDARTISASVDQPIDLLYTSPPYANRMSYIRELRPYMYWLGYLNEPREAGDLDWTAIGGTWGIATSRVAAWESVEDVPLDGDFAGTVDAIRTSGSRNADLLSRYVHKYTDDMWEHFKSAVEVIRPGGRAVYIVGNSTFFGHVVSVQDWYADLMREAGFRDVSVEVIRKRNSKKALFEYAVQGTRS